jgi:hypothetical protein
MRSVAGTARLLCVAAYIEDGVSALVAESEDELLAVRGESCAGSLIAVTAGATLILLLRRGIGFARLVDVDRERPIDVFTIGRTFGARVFVIKAAWSVGLTSSKTAQSPTVTTSVTATTAIIGPFLTG